MIVSSFVKHYLSGLYQNTMSRIYDEALDRAAESLSAGGCCLDCGAGNGHLFNDLQQLMGLELIDYLGIEWNIKSALQTKEVGLRVIPANLNNKLPFKDRTFQTVIAFSVLEHLVNGCKFLRETHRVLKPGGRLILITPNLSAWFNIVLLSMGKMPSSGPHPDSKVLTTLNTPIQFRPKGESQVEDATPNDRHLVVFTFKVLKTYLNYLGFKDTWGKPYGLYPFPNISQPFFEKIDPWHCHQLLFDCRR